MPNVYILVLCVLCLCRRNVHVEEAFIIRLTLDKQYHFPQSQMLLYDTFKKQKMTFERVILIIMIGPVLCLLFTYCFKVYGK